MVGGSSGTSETTGVDKALGLINSEDWLYRERGAVGSGGWTKSCEGSTN